MNQPNSPQVDLLTPAEVSQWTGVTVGALAQLRYRGAGPKFRKLTPRTVRYTRGDVEEWIASSVRTDTTGSA